MASLKAWIKAARLRTLPLATTCVMIGGALGFKDNPQASYLLLVLAALVPQQKVLRLDVAVDVALRVQLLQDVQRLARDARDHLLRHALPVQVPDIPQAGAEKVHDHDVVVPLPALVEDPWHAVDAGEGVVDAPLVGRPVVAAL